MSPSRSTPRHMHTAVRVHEQDVRRWLSQAGVPRARLQRALADVLAEFCLAFEELPSVEHGEFLRAAAHRAAAAHADVIAGSAAALGALPELLEIPDIAATEDTAATELDVRRARAYLIGALSVLPRTERTLFMSARWQGKSRGQIAKELDMPKGSVATGLRRAEDLLGRALYNLRDQDRRGLAAHPGPLPAWAAPGRRRPGVDVVARSEATVLHGGWLFVNNQWARARVHGLCDQCLLFRRSGSPAAGWSWSWPRQQALPIAFPQAIYGTSPWRDGTTTDARFPVQLGRLRTLQLDFDVRTTALGQYTLLLVIYLVDARRDREVGPAAITTEVTLVLDHRGDTLPAGAVIDTPLIDGMRYDVRRIYAMGGPDLLGYPAFFFTPRLPRRCGRLDLLGLLDYFERRRWIDTALSVASIELGNEVHRGAGTTWLERLKLDIELV